MTEWLPYSEQTASLTQFCRFVARQPILDRVKKTFGYELLFRTGWENRFCADGEVASRHMIDNAVSYGMDSLVGDGIPFVNCTRDLLVKRLPTLLPRYTVLEILEDVTVDDELIAACRELHGLGYRLALDDFDFSENWEKLLPYVTYIKLDFRTSTRKQRADLMFRLRHRSICFVAEKIETQEEFREALDEGFTLFQGYFFHRPVVLARPSLTTVVNRFRFLSELSSASLDRDKMVQMLKGEPSISYRLLRLANSAAVSTREPMKSLSAALAMIGDDQFRKMALLALATEFSGGKSVEPIRFILQRARFCELMAEELHADPPELYLFGMLSVVRSTLQLSKSDLTKTLRLAPEMVSALEGAQNFYSDVLELAISHEKGQWTRLAEIADRLDVAEEMVALAALCARKWTENILNLV
jgi:EAL and modified HD-GYP domain-containing signal transduction protein